MSARQSEHFETKKRLANLLLSLALNLILHIHLGGVQNLLRTSYTASVSFLFLFAIAHLLSKRTQFRVDSFTILNLAK